MLTVLCMGCSCCPRVGHGAFMSLRCLLACMAFALPLGPCALSWAELGSSFLGCEQLGHRPPHSAGGSYISSYDSLLFFRANNENATVLKNVLLSYCNASGQQINMEKSSIHFAKGVRQQVRDGIKGILQVQNEALNGKFLGMPVRE